MAAESADRNLLFGVLAVQLDFVSRDDLIAATSRWALDQQQPLSKVFVEQGFLSDEESRLLEGIVQKHVARNGDDPRRSLQSIEGVDAILARLAESGDDEFRKTIGYGGDYSTLAVRSNDPYTTQGPVPGATADAKHRFSILRLHQKGGLGRVSIALDEELNREIALKEILPAHADNEENRTRFVREAEITGALEHPGVVPVYSLGQFADGRPYYAMRFIRGVNLQIAIEDYRSQEADVATKQLQFRQLLTRFVDVCLAIEYAHSRGVIHRDLKPGNVMLGDYGETLVVDWGLAKSLGDGFETADTTVAPISTSKRASSTKTQIGRVVGTPTYMSPEQAAGRLDALGPCSDIYSLGATLYQLLTGQVAFQGKEDEVLGNVQLGRFPRPRQINNKVPRALEAICLKAMARLPDDRYATGRELAEDIERYLADERVLAYDEPLHGLTWRWIRNHKPLVISSAAALTVVVAALTGTVIKLQASNVRERALRAEATENFQKAERNFGLARDAVREYYVAVSEETLLKQPGMQQLRDTLLRQALVYYQSFLEERKDDPELREEVAQAYFYTGLITATIDSPADALPHFERAVALQAELLVDDPERQELLTDYGTTLNAYGGAYDKIGKFDDALVRFQQAADIRRKVAAASPDDVEAARTLANSLMNIGAIFLRTGQIDEAVRQMNQAQGIRMAHVQEVATADVKLQRDLAKGHYMLAVTSFHLGDLTNAETNFLTAIEVFGRLLESDPNNMNHQRNLAACHRMVGDLKSNVGESEQAVEFYHQAVAALEELRQRNPEVLLYSFDLARVYLQLGNESAADSDAAIGWLEEAVDLLRQLTEHAPAVPGFRIQLGVALRDGGKLLAQAGNLEEARRQLKESKAVFSQLVKEDLTSAEYTSQLQQSDDELARVRSELESAE